MNERIKAKLLRAPFLTPSQGNENFKHGIEILTAADYFTLGNRVNAYTEISCFVASFEEYKRPIMSHLAEVRMDKLRMDKQTAKA